MSFPSIPLAYSMSVLVAVAALHCRSKKATLLDEARVARLIVPELTVASEDLGELLVPDTSEVGYKPATAADEQVFAQIIPGLTSLSSADHPDLEHWNGLAHRIGYALERWQVGGDVYAVLRELAHQRRGRGTYVFRIAPPDSDAAPPTLILQAPHVYFDVGTGDLAIHMFFESPGRGHVRALYMNSLHRYQQSPGVREEQKNNPADVCHNRRHLFNTATRLAAEHAAPLAVVQLHGFDARVDGDGSEVDVIVSATPTARTETIATALQERFEKRTIRRYPDQIAELGGEDNVQRKVLAGHADTTFAHIELSRAFRRYLRKRGERRDRLAAALVSSITGVDPPAGSSP